MSNKPNFKCPATLEHLKKKEPLEAEIPICLSDAPVERVEACRKAILVAEQGLAAALPEAEEECQRALTEAKLALDEALEGEAESIVWMKFRSIGRKAYDDLVKLHPPTDEQKAEAEKLGTMAFQDPDSFPPALVAASCVQPDLTEQDAIDIFDTWNTTESFQLYATAMRVNTGRRSAGNEDGGT